MGPVRLVARPADNNLQGPVYRDALIAMTQAVVSIAAQKNVPLELDGEMPIARQALSMLDATTMRDLLRMEAEAIVAAQRAINHALDVLATVRLGYAIAEMEHKEPLSPAAMVASAKNALAAQHANDKSAFMRVWPDIAAAALAHHEARAARVTQPVHIRMPKSVSRVSYATKRKSANVAEETAMGRELNDG